MFAGIESGRLFLLVVPMLNNLPVFKAGDVGANFRAEKVVVSVSKHVIADPESAHGYHKHLDGDPRSPSSGGVSYLSGLLLRQNAGETGLSVGVARAVVLGVVGISAKRPLHALCCDLPWN